MPQTEKKRKVSKKVEVIILIADIENSSHIAESIPSREYNNMLREYHRIAFRALNKYTPRIMEQRIVAQRAFGDEILLLVQNKYPVETLTNVLSLAVFFEVEWSRSRFNSKRIHDYKTPCRLRVGVGHGEVILAESIWEQGMTPEGYAIATAKRIEANAGGALNEPHILVAASLKPILEQVKGIEICQSIVIPENKSKGIGAIEAIRLKSYEGLYSEFRQNIKIIDKYSRWYTRGYQAYSAGDYEEAVRCYRRAAENRPNSPNAMSSLAGVLIHLGKLDEAENVVRDALKINPNWKVALNNLGSILTRKRKFEDSIPIFKRLIKIDPENEQYYYNLGTAQNEIELLDEAASALNMAIEIKPDYIHALANLAEVRIKQGRPEEGVILAKRALAINPDDEEIRLFMEICKLFNAGIRLKEDNHFLEAEKAFKETTKLRPNNYITHYFLGEVLYTQKRYNEAEKSFKRVLEIMPNNKRTLDLYNKMKALKGKSRQSL
jgi:tetratricopeptide (TPR) repeat protein